MARGDSPPAFSPDLGVLFWAIAWRAHPKSVPLQRQKKQSMTENPFIAYGYESPACSCDRKVETHESATLLAYGNQAALISPRRMGKTQRTQM